MATVGILGKKLGMTQLFLKNGKVVPITVISVAGGNWVLEVKTKENNGYESCQIAFEDCSKKSIKKPVSGYLQKKGITPKRYIREIRNMVGFRVGSRLGVELFKEKDKIKVSAISKGKGFAGIIKRHKKSRGSMSHGSGYHRGVGSIGSGRNRNRVIKGKKMPGRMGNEKTTIKNLVVEKIDKEKQVIFLKGAVPGSKKKLVTLLKE